MDFYYTVVLIQRKLEAKQLTRQDPLDIITAENLNLSPRPRDLHCYDPKRIGDEAADIITAENLNFYLRLRNLHYVL